MELIRGIHNIQPRHRGCVLSIGNFDGVHLGHQALLHELKQQAQVLGLPVMVMVFEPQPLEFFAADKAPARLTRLRDKCKYLAQSGIDYLLCIKFDARLASLSAEDFVEQLLVKKLDVKHVIVGDDFRFGVQRSGDNQRLKQLAQQHQFTALNTESFLSCDGQRISSTAIRQALGENALLTAQTLLGRPYSISGRIAHGDALGRTIGFPTANIALYRYKSAVNGVYAVDVSGYGDSLLHGVANIGTRPTIAGIRQQLEVHLLDFNQNLYGRHLEVIFRAKLRDEQRFASLDDLKQQITHDVAAARQFFGLATAV